MARLRALLPATLLLLIVYVLYSGVGISPNAKDAIHEVMRQPVDMKPPPPVGHVDYAGQRPKPPVDAFKLPAFHSDGGRKVHAEHIKGINTEGGLRTEEENGLQIVKISGGKKGPFAPKVNHDRPSEPTTTTEAISSQSTSPAQESSSGTRRAIVTSCFDPACAGMALMLGWSIKKHNDVASLNADMILLNLNGSDSSLTTQNIKYLEKVWTIRNVSTLPFISKNSAIKAPQRHNLNRLAMFNWTEYDKVVYINPDAVVKGSITDLFQLPGEFAAAPDMSQPRGEHGEVVSESRFGSGIMVFEPSEKTFKNMVDQASDSKYHGPKNADQAFLQAYWEYRFFGLPYKYNLNSAMYESHLSTWRLLWDEAVVVHLTNHKPNPDPAKHCNVPGCRMAEPLQWYKGYYDEMRHALRLQDEIPLLG